MIYQTTPTALFSSFFIGHLFLALIGVGGIFAARHPNDRGKIGIVMTWLRHIIGISFVIIGCIGTFNITTAYLQGPTDTTQTLQQQTTYSCERSGKCYALELANNVLIGVKEGVVKQTTVGFCYNIFYYKVNLPLYRYQNLALSVEQKQANECEHPGGVQK